MPALTQTGVNAVRALFLDAKEAIEDLGKDVWKDPNMPRDGVLPGQWDGAPYANMPPDCPVTVLGLNDGEDGGVWVLTATRMLKLVSRWDATTLAEIYSPHGDYLLWAWPAFAKDRRRKDEDGNVETIRGGVDRIEVQKAALCHINEAGRKGSYNPADKQRGRGGWLDDAEGHNRFLWHSGRYLWRLQSGKMTRALPSKVGRHIYTNLATTIEPWQTPVKQEESPAIRILQHLRTWNWERPYIDPLLILGFLATCLYGGALDQRPIIFTTGGAGVGKSTLQEMFRKVLADVVFTAVDTTAAGIYQRAKKDSLPFMVDELEAKAGSTKAQSIIQLARVAYSGGDISRGGADHEGTTFKMFNSFLFSAILPPPMHTQDKTRMAILNLKRLDKPGNGVGTLEVLETDGRMILRQCMDGFDEFHRLKQDYFETLAKQGFDSRAIDTYGSLLAGAQMLVGAELFEEVGLPVDDQLRLGEIIRTATALERSEQKEPWLQCLEYLLSVPLPHHSGGERMTVGNVIERISSLEGDDFFSVDKARRLLNIVGLSIQPADPAYGGMAKDYWLCVPPSGDALEEIFRKTDWNSGNWFVALKQGPDSVVLRNLPNQRCKVSINRSKLTCVLVSMTALDMHYDKQGQDKDEPAVE